MEIKQTDGSKYIPYDKRCGNESIVYFTRDLSGAGLKKVYNLINANIFGKVAVKLHTGEKNGPNIIPRPWVQEFMSDLPNAAIVETNTYYDGDRYTTELHRETLKVNGWTFCPVDIMDSEGCAMLPVKGGNRLKEISVGKSLLNYDSLVALTHFKGHTLGGFGGSNKNIGIGCADGRVGKGMIHQRPGTSDMWGNEKENFMECMTESAKAAIDYFGIHTAYINVMRNMSVSCDCEGCAAQPVVTPNIGITASTDILAVDQASVDLVYALEEKDHADLLERIQSRHGLRQLTYMKELGMGNDKYVLIDVDNGGQRISLKDAVKHVVPFKA